MSTENTFSYGKCSLLKPVDNLTGTFFLFSQYTQDLTKQYSNPNGYRCIPSKYIALNLEYSDIINSCKSTDIETTEDNVSKKLGEIFQNYFENACTFLRGVYGNEWNPVYTRTLLFQTLEKYNLIHCEDYKSENIQCIGDINIYSNTNTEDGVGYNEIYCYIPNNETCKDYQLKESSISSNFVEYTDESICGYTKDALYNGLTGDIAGYIDIVDSKNTYLIGTYNNINTLEPSFLEDETYSTPDRKENDQILDKFNVNSIVVLYDIVSKTGEITYKNVPLGIYFTGKPVVNEDLTTYTCNAITKYVDSGQIYNQGTSYGLRICTRFLSNPNSTEVIENKISGASYVSEIAPVLEKMSDTIASANNVIKTNKSIYDSLDEHLALFKNNKTNVPYIRELNGRKYWFVNGKNTGAIAELGTEAVLQNLETILKEYIDEQIAKLK